MLRFAQTCEAVAGTTKKLEKTALVSGYLTSLPTDDAAIAAIFFSGRPFPSYRDTPLQVGGALLWRTIAEISGKSEAELSEIYRRHGDAGSVTAEALPPRPASVLTLHTVQQTFEQIAATRGSAPKAQLLRQLLEQATLLEGKYIVKIIGGDLRIGLKESLVEEAIAKSFAAPLDQVKRANMLLGDIGETLRLAATNRLVDAHMRLFHPIDFMLASPVDSPEEALSYFENAAVEDKYDGIRAHAHICGGEVRLFSRTRDEITESFPEIPPALAWLPQDSVLDGEIVAWSCGAGAPASDAWSHIVTAAPAVEAEPNSVGKLSARIPAQSENLDPCGAGIPAQSENLNPCGAGIPARHADPVSAALSGRALPFSTLQQRLGRKKVSPRLLRDVPVAYLVFDVLYADGKLLFERPLRERAKILDALLCGAGAAARAKDTSAGAASGSPQSLFAFAAPDVPLAPILRAPVSIAHTPDDLESLFTAARARGNEGLMIKDLDSLYTPGRRGKSWLKMKRELATLDVVVTAVEYGHGKRIGVLSDYSFAVWDGDRLVNIGKAYSGLTDAEIAEMTKWFLAHVTRDEGMRLHVEPKIVLEVAFNNMMRSDRHESGYALRFPRILRIRTDKPPAEADTIETAKEIYERQK